MLPAVSGVKASPCYIAMLDFRLSTSSWREGRDREEVSSVNSAKLRKAGSSYSERGRNSVKHRWLAARNPYFGVMEWWSTGVVAAKRTGRGGGSGFEWMCQVRPRLMLACSRYRTAPRASFTARFEVPLAKFVFFAPTSDYLLKPRAESWNSFGFGQAQAGQSWLTCSSSRGDVHKVCPAGGGSFVVEMKRMEKAFARKTK
jgi:hypothetical protein